MQTVGSENLASPTQDGPTNLPDSAEAALLALREESEAEESSQSPAVVVPKTPEQASAEWFKSIGISKAAVKKLLAASKHTTYLTSRITAAVNMTHYANTQEKVALAMGFANKIARDKKAEHRDRAYACAVVAQLAVSMARIGESNLVSARQLDEPDKENNVGKTTVNVNGNAVFGFPPVSSSEPKAIAISGNPE